MKIIKQDKIFEPNIKFSDVITSIENSRQRIRSLSNVILTSCSLLISTSLVILFFLIKDMKLVNMLLISIEILISNLFLILSICFCLFSVYVREPSIMTTQFNMISQQAHLLLREQKNAKIATIFLLLGLVIFLVSIACVLLEINSKTLLNPSVN